MDTDIIVAGISLLGTLGGSLGGILVSSKMTAYRLEQQAEKTPCGTCINSVKMDSCIIISCRYVGVRR